MRTPAKRNRLLPIVLLASLALQAQTDLQNNGIFYLSGGTDTAYITGSLTNASGAGLTNNGNLYIRQNLINGQSPMTIGTGTLYFNGSTAQSLSGTQPFKTFNFVSNNGSGIMLNNDLSISGSHTFIAGLIASSATPNYLIYEAGASYTGDGNAQHASGWVRKNGTTNFIFPVGNNTVERPIGITGLSALSTFNANYAGATTNTANVASPLVTVDPYEYWQLNQSGGGTAQVAMNWDKSRINFPPYALSAIRVANYTAGSWTTDGGSAAGNVTSTGTISSPSISVFGPFTFGSISFALPVELLSFSARRVNDNTVVDWTTTGEVNVNDYEVQRSDDGSSFYIAGTVAARNLPSVQQYELTDNKPLKNVAYYRLRSVDIDGNYKLSAVVAVTDRTGSNSYFVVTNPVHDALNVSAGSIHNGDYEYHIISTGGQLMQAGRLTISNGGSYQVPLNQFIVPGIYIVEFRKEGFSYSQRILVQ